MAGTAVIRPCLGQGFRLSGHPAELLGQPPEAFCYGGVMGVIAELFASDQAGFPQDLHVLGDRGLADAQLS